MTDDQLRIGLCQIAPVWLNKKQTIAKVLDYLGKAANEKCDLAVFGECLVPGYPFWLELTDGAAFNSEFQKEIYAHYLQESVDLAKGDLDPICSFSKQHKLAIYLGILERGNDRGKHTVYCTLVYISEEGKICSSYVGINFRCVEQIFPSSLI